MTPETSQIAAERRRRIARRIPRAAGAGACLLALAAADVCSADDSLGEPFSTKYARFEPAPFSALPGWAADSVRESLNALRHSCRALGRKSVWDALCAEGEGMDAADERRIRAFFERRFHAYSVRNPDESDEGMITGYYEPLLEGSRARGPRYPYPVLGVPADLFYLDAKTAASGNRLWLKREGQRLAAASEGEPGASLYDIDLGGLRPGIRDKRYRVRVADHRIAPYWTRQDIERGMPDARVLAWVSDAYALYSMQIQGSGKIRMADGAIVRVAYGEQNGHPFLPQAASAASAPEGAKVRTRGTAASNPDIDAIIAVLSGKASARPAAVPQPVPASAPAVPAAGPAGQAGQAATGIGDPSYVFFRPIPDNPHGPLGALGVPLTAGRSIAVDPRTTPLGYPVFVSTDAGGASGNTVNRLMFAQDTGGAIRGAVRADYFWGFGPGAGDRASRMKEVGRMWLLLPRGLQSSAMTASLRVRSLGDGASLAECVVPDPDNCVEE